MDKKINEAARELGRRGGKAVLKKYNKDHFKELGKKSGEARRKRAEEKKKEEKEQEPEKKS